MRNSGQTTFQAMARQGQTIDGPCGINVVCPEWHFKRRPVSDRVQHHAAHCSAVDFFNALTAPGLFVYLDAHLRAHRERLFPPTGTLSRFLAQALSADGSCRWTVDQAATFRLLSGLPTCSTATRGYCRARARLPTALIRQLTRFTADWAYNLIRALMADPARYADVLPRQLSFKHTVQLGQSWRCTAI